MSIALISTRIQAYSSPRRSPVLWMGMVVFLINGMDLLSTWIVSPNLEGEWNLLQRVFGLGWLGLFAAKLIGGAMAVAGYSFYLRHRRNCFPLEKLQDYSSFVRFFTFGPEEPMLSPQGLTRLGVSLGYFWAAMQVLVLWVALDNMLILQGYFCPIRNVSEMGYHMLQSALIGGAAVMLYYRVNFRLYNQNP